MWKYFTHLQMIILCFTNIRVVFIFPSLLCIFTREQVLYTFRLLIKLPVWFTFGFVFSNVAWDLGTEQEVRALS